MKILYLSSILKEDKGFSRFHPLGSRQKSEKILLLICSINFNP